MKTPKQVLDEMIKTHGYEHINVEKIDKEYYSVKSFNDIPDVIIEYINDNYNIYLFSRNYIEFWEFHPISIEFYFN